MKHMHVLTGIIRYLATSLPVNVCVMVATQKSSLTCSGETAPSEVKNNK